MKKFWKYIAGVLVGGGLAVGAVIPTSTALFETSLVNSISTTDTTMTLVSATTKDGTTLSGTYAFIIDEGTANEEFVSASCASTVCTSLTRGLSVVNGTSTISALKKKHRVGASVKITDAPQLLILSRILNGDETVPNALRYNAEPSWTYGLKQLVSWDKAKDYTDSVALAGAPNADETTNGVVELATSLEQASSTALGSTGASLVLQSRYATDTPTSGCAVGYTGTAGAGCSVIATLTGKIKQTFLDIFSTVNTWTGQNTFNATTTFNATSSRTGPEYGLFGLSVGTTTATTSGNVIIENGLKMTSGSYLTGWASSTAYEIVSATDGLNYNSTDWVDTTVSCSSGKVVLGGGYVRTTAGNQTGHTVPTNGPVGNNSWKVEMKSSSGSGADTITIYAICVKS